MVAIPLKQGRLEAALIGRGLEGFQRRVEVELQPSGIAELDGVLGGGFPRGSLVELCGPASSGRTSLAFSLLAQATERLEVCAFVDVSDSLDPLPLGRIRITRYPSRLPECCQSLSQQRKRGLMIFTNDALTLLSFHKPQAMRSIAMTGAFLWGWSELRPGRESMAEARAICPNKRLAVLVY